MNGVIEVDPTRLVTEWRAAGQAVRGQVQSCEPPDAAGPGTLTTAALGDAVAGFAAAKGSATVFIDRLLAAVKTAAVNHAGTEQQNTASFQ